MASEAVDHRNLAGFSAPLLWLPSGGRGLVIANVFPSGSCTLTVQESSAANLSILKKNKTSSSIWFAIKFFFFFFLEHGKPVPGFIDSGSIGDAYSGV